MSIPYWRLSSFYFFYFAALGSFTPYWSLYLKNTGFNNVEIGEQFALLVGVRILASNFWGCIADHTERRLLIIRTTSLISALIFASFMWAKGYLWFAGITVALSFFWNAGLPQFETVTLLHLKEEPQRYSKIRLWGSIGFIVAVSSVGEAIDRFSSAVLPMAITALLALTGFSALFVPNAQSTQHDAEPVGFLRLLFKTEVLMFLLVGMLVQIAHTPYYVFYSIYLKQQHYAGSIIGGLWALGIIAEILLFLVMKRLQTRFSMRSIFLASLLLSIVRWLLIGFFPDNLYLLLSAQLLHAATFGGVHVASIHFVRMYFGKLHQGKGQALYASLCFGLGGMIGSFYGGYFWDKAGADFVFSIGACACTLALLLSFIWIGRNPHRFNAFS
ncbi:MFS transporter [Methylocucumis oryzae]|uniref:MFS transporter n=1 Tax=Methylocucumis oryzae TaxID=1632867 RepID=UPI000696476F|nr:MFS transporter [Methylocucumis oryzae]